MDASQAQSATMDGIYRHQRLIYDVSRKYFLLGRDHLIRQIRPAPGARILEVACGTGRNLDLIDRIYPGRALCGLDISAEMLKSARRKLAGRADLAEADACSFNPQALFGIDRFDHIVMSYSLSMIPDWQGAIAESLSHLAPGGCLHIVDFADQSGLPRWFHTGLRGWLARFHVTPRTGLARVLSAQAGTTTEHRLLYRSYAQYACLQRDIV